MRPLAKVLLLLVVLLAVAVPGTARADVNDFTADMRSDETLTTADHQGSLRIVEHIDVDFHDYNHGILRAIPNSYKNHKLQMHVNSVTSTADSQNQFSTYTSNGNTVLKIGDPNRTVTGKQSYTIDYTLRNVITFYPDHDELYWDVNGDQWQQNFDRVSVSLHLPDSVRVSNPAQCYTGSFGSTASNCTVQQNDKDIVITADNVAAAQTLTYVVGFQKGVFAPSKLTETLAEYLSTILKIAILPLLALIIGLGLWLRSGRDPRGRQVIVPEYTPPDNLPVEQVGTLLDFKTDNKDITAMIIGLAVRGYIKIIESTKKKRFAKDELVYSLELKNTDYSALSANEVQLMDTLFLQPTHVGQTYDLDKPKNRLYTCAASIRDDCAKQLTESGYFRGTPKRAGLKQFIIAGILVAAIYFFGTVVGVGLAAGAGIAAVILVGFGLIMPARTKLGVEALEKIKGLKMYMDVAEKDRIAKLQAPGAAYATNAGEPVRTVELFEKLLPFAIVLGVEEQWARQFADIYKTAPDWYAGNWTTFNSLYLVNGISSGVGMAVNTSFSAPQSSNSSGFGGGGFSGGGGGGGGGGGW
jgi:uncharacterized membrane protein YgcG